MTDREQLVELCEKMGMKCAEDPSKDLRSWEYAVLRDSIVLGRGMGDEGALTVFYFAGDKLVDHAAMG